MTTLTAHYREVIERLPTDSTLILRGISWAEYEELIEAVGEAPGLRISYDQGMMQIVTLSSEHKSFARLIERLVDRLSSRLRIKVLSSGSATMKHSRCCRNPTLTFTFRVQPLSGTESSLTSQTTHHRMSWLRSISITIHYPSFRFMRRWV